MTAEEDDSVATEVFWKHDIYVKWRKEYASYTSMFKM